MLKVKDLINQSEEDLKGTYNDLCREIFELKNEQRVSRNIEKPHLVKEKKKDRARVLTALRQKTLGML